MSYNTVTGSDFYEFADRTQRLLPFDLIEKALRDNPATAPHRRGIEDIHALMGVYSDDHVDHAQGPLPYRNPDIFPSMIALIISDDSTHIERHLGNLRLHLAARDAREVEGLDDGYYRLVHSHGSLLRVREGNKRDVHKELTFRTEGSRPIVYLPADELFNDLVDTTLYPRVSEQPDAPALASLVANAMSMLRQYSPEVWADFQQVISSIVLTPDFGHPDRWSYSYRLNYFGGIFINPFRVNVYGMVESLIHEYYHQRLWQWWAYEDLPGMPPEDVTVISPVTGNRRSVQVMAHALLIYISALHFYAHQLQQPTAQEAQEREWLTRRALLLHEGIPQLYESLRTTSPPRTAALVFLDSLMEQFSAIQLPGGSGQAVL
jgi:HEXXH motif-containing protein